MVSSGAGSPRLVEVQGLRKGAVAGAEIGGESKVLATLSFET